jgi:DNA-binding MarR family transcriptional regulator
MKAPLEGHDPWVREVLDAIRRMVRALRLTARAAERRFGLSGAQLFVLKTLAEGSALSLNELAERTSTDQSSVSVVVRRLAERGLVSRIPDPRDGRRLRIALTAKGRAIVRRAPPLAQTALLGAIHALPPEARQVLATQLEALTKRMGVSEGRAGMLFDDGGSG